MLLALAVATVRCSGTHSRAPHQLCIWYRYVQYSIRRLLPRGSFDICSTLKWWFLRLQPAESVARLVAFRPCMGRIGCVAERCQRQSDLAHQLVQDSVLRCEFHSILSDPVSIPEEEKATFRRCNRVPPLSDNVRQC